MNCEDIYANKFENLEVETFLEKLTMDRRKNRKP